MQESKILEKVRNLAVEMRRIQFEMSRRFPCYLGSSLSVTDILAVLYGAVLKVDAAEPKNARRDVLVLSKGHASPALYAALSLKGFLPREQVLNHSTLNSPVYYHPNIKIPGIELSTGSLGMGLSFGLGTALIQKRKGLKSRTFVIIGDGELNEGSNWESIMSAPAFKLGNLVAIIDRNGWQANERTEKLIPLENLEAKWKSFGWRVKTTDGHDYAKLLGVFTAVPKGANASRPLVVIADTIRNKGISFQEDQRDAWNWQLSEEEYAKACEELDKGKNIRVKKIAATGKTGFKE